MIKTSVIKQREIHESILSTIKDIENMTESTCLIDRFHDNSSNIIQNLIYRRYLLKSGVDKNVSDVILREAISCENRCAGSGEIFLSTVCIFLNKIIKESRFSNIDSIIEKIKKIIINDSHKISKMFSKLNSSSFKTIMIDNFPERKLFEIMWDMFGEIRLDTSVSVKKTSKQSSEFFIDTGHRVVIKNFKITSIKNSWNRSNVECLIVDGSIETVGEIHHMLETASIEKRPTLLICRKISDDVKQTILHNLRRGTIDLLAIEVDFLIESTHFFKDIEVLTGCDIVSPIKGDTVSNGVKHNMFTLEKLVLSENILKIYTHEKSEDLLVKIEHHLLEIKDHRGHSSDINNEIISEIFSNRIRMFSSSCCDLYIGRDILDSHPNAIARIDTMLRSCKDMSSCGIVDTLELNDIKILEINRKIVNQNQVFYAFISALKTATLLTNTKRMLTIDTRQ